MPSSPVCLDASFLLHWLIGGEAESQADALLEEWHRTGRPLIAPTLLHYEVTNALHRDVVRGWLLPEEARTLLDFVLRLGLHIYGDAELHRRALQLAEALSLPAAYDAHYLALAERVGAEFWTTDRRLANKVREALPWVHLLA
jgi:predicted nucleic acid-binding protein